MYLIKHQKENAIMYAFEFRQLSSSSTSRYEFQFVSVPNTVYALKGDFNQFTKYIACS